MDIQSANRQHPVPQNVMEVEFKLIGDLTIRQFTYLLFFGIMAMLSAYAGLPNLFKIPLVGFFVIVGVSFAFIPLNDITLDKWTINYIKAILRPRFRIWMHTKNTPYFLTYIPTFSPQQNTSHSLGTANKQKLSLDELLNSDKPKFISFKDDTDIENKEKEFFKKLGLKTDNTSNIVKDLNLKNNQIQIDTPTTQNTRINSFVLPDKKREPNLKLKMEDIQEEHELKNTLSNISITKNATPIQTNPVINLEIQQNQITPNLNTGGTIKTSEPKLTDSNQIAEVPEIKGIKVEPTKKDEKYESEIINYQKHIKELNLLKQKLLKELEQNKYKVLEGKEEEVAKITVKERTATLQRENKELKDKLKKITEQKIINSEKAGIEKSPFFASFLLKIKGEKENEVPQDNSKTNVGEEFVGSVNTPDDAETIRSKIKGKNITKKTFKLKGSTNDINNNLIPDVIIIVKNEAGEAVRALKSNTVGEFESSTELTVGNYLIEATKEDYIFKTLNLKASDNDKGLVKLIGTKK